MATQRPERVQEAIREEVAKIIQHEIKDPRLGFVTVTRVELTRDLRFARIYFSALGDAKVKQKALKGLNSAKGTIKGMLAGKVKLKFMPDIMFKIDDSFENTKHIYDLLDKIKREREMKEPDDETGAGSDKEV
jgi:ribosome-binding factor A